MDAKYYDLNFNRYVLDENVNDISNISGIYCVYTCVVSEDVINLSKLIYIGESDDVRGRIDGHEKYDIWKSYLKSGETLCYGYAFAAPAEDRLRAEAGMIFEHKPPVNDEYKSNFPFDKTTIATSGNSELLHEQFTVERS